MRTLARRSSRAVPLLCLVLISTTSLTACDTTVRSCEHRAWVSNIALSGGFTGAEVKESVKWRTSGVGGPCVGNATEDMWWDSPDGDSNMCYYNPLIDFTTLFNCFSYQVEKSPPWGAMQLNNEGVFSWTQPAGKYTKSGSFRLITQIRVEHQSGNNEPRYLPGCFQTGFLYMNGELDCTNQKQY